MLQMITASGWNFIYEGIDDMWEISEPKKWVGILLFALFYFWDDYQETDNPFENFESFGTHKKIVNISTELL